MASRTVVVELAGEEVGRYRVHDLGAAGRRRSTPLQDADAIAEARLRLRLQGASAEDLDGAEFRVLHD